MTKIIVLQCVNEDGFSHDCIFVGNEYSRDPSDMMQLINTQFHSHLKGNTIVVHSESINFDYNETSKKNVIQVLNKNGYVEFEPKRIIV